MFESMKKHLTVRNVLIGTAVVGAVGGLVYWALKDDNASDVVDAAAVAGESLVEATGDVIADAVTATE